MGMYDPGMTARILAAASPMEEAAAKANAAWQASQGATTPIATKGEFIKAQRVKQGVDAGAGGSFTPAYNEGLKKFSQFDEISKSFRPEYAGDPNDVVGEVKNLLDAKYNNTMAHPTISKMYKALGIAPGRSDFWGPYGKFMQQEAAMLSHGKALTAQHGEEDFADTVGARMDAATPGESPESVQKKLTMMRGMLGQELLQAFVLDTAGRNPLLADRARKYIGGAKDTVIEKSLPPAVREAKRAMDEWRAMGKMDEMQGGGTTKTGGVQFLTVDQIRQARARGRSK